MSKQRINLGKFGEQTAASYLADNGFEIIERNYRNKFGEIDIIACKEDVYVFIEVKTRRNDKFGSPEEAVTPAKQKQICKVAQSYILQKKLPEKAIRFDVIAIMHHSGQTDLNHISAAFDAQ